VLWKDHQEELQGDQAPLLVRHVKGGKEEILQPHGEDRLWELPDKALEEAGNVVHRVAGKVNGLHGPRVKDHLELAHSLGIALFPEDAVGLEHG